MDRPQNGFEFLELLREKKAEDKLSFGRYERYLEMNAREKGIPITGQFELTPLCNFDCRMCYVHLTGDQLRGRSVMTAPQWKMLMEQACEAGMYKATLSGGECLSYPGFKELYLFLQSRGCRITVLTNGSLLDAEWIRFFQNHPPASIRITLYGHDEDSYERVTGKRCFKTVCGHIRMIREAGLPLTVSITPNIYLGEDVFETVRTAKSLCPHLMISNALFDPREETGRAGQDADVDLDYYCRIHRLKLLLEGKECREIPEDLLPKIGGPSHASRECGLLCGGGRSGFSIDWQGTMRPCERLQNVKAYPLRDGFMQAWKAVNQAVESWPRVPECDGCAYFPTCIICAAHMMNFADPGRQPLELCRRTRYMVQHGVWHIPSCE